MVRKVLLVALAITAVSMPLSAQYIGWPDTNAAASASNNTFPMGFDTEWRFQYILPAVCFPSASFKIEDMALAQHGSFSSTNPGIYSDFQVRMALTTAPTLSTNFDANLGNCPVTVMNRPGVGTFTWAYAPDTWVDFGLDCKFGYDGTSNLVIEIRYRGGSTASLPMRAENPPGANRVFTRGAGAYNSTTAAWNFPTSLPKTRFTIDRTCVLQCSPQVSIGSRGKVGVIQASSGAPYQIATALGHASILNFGSCSICINPDFVFFWSISGFPLFTNYSGNVGTSGSYSGVFAVPNASVLVGVCLSHASITINPLCCTNTATTEIVP